MRAMQDDVSPFAGDLGIPRRTRPRVVVVGGGFGGIELVKRLGSKDFQVVLLDRKNFHTFQPLLYQVATAGLEPTSIVVPFRALFKRQPDFHFRMTEVSDIDLDHKLVLTSSGTLHYDVLVLAQGCTTNFFGNEDARKRSLPMKTVPEALDIRALVLENFEEALVTSDEGRRKGVIDVVIVGGGPTGVELAGAFAELKRHVLPRDYPDLSIDGMVIHLVEAGDRLLSAMSKGSGNDALEMLNKLGVQVHLQSPVVSYDGRTATLANGAQLDAGTLIWSAGVTVNDIGGFQELQLTKRQRRIVVDAELRVKNARDVYALGDAAAVITTETPDGHPQVAPVAIQQGRLLAENLKRLQRGKAPTPFRYRDQGSMATIGRNRAVVELGRLRFKGSFAWFVWMFVHLMSIVGFRNRLAVLIEWTINYFTYDRSFRLVFRNKRRRFGGNYDDSN